MPIRTTRKPKPAAALPSNDDVAPRRRRSARLSGDKEPIIPGDPVKRRPGRPSKEPQPEPQSAHIEIEHFPQSGVRGLRVSKSRDGTKIALPFSDTPVIKRNKEMRAAQNKGSSSHRRSSAGSRGKRASSLIESGTSNGRDPISGQCLKSPVILANFEKDALLRNSLLKPDGDGEKLNEFPVASPPPEGHQDMENSADMIRNFIAVPHADVDVWDFYKLIDQQGLTEQRRMHQLLIWCASRALLEKPRPDDGIGTIEMIAIESGRLEIKYAIHHV